MLELDGARGLEDAVARLVAIPGIGAWTAHYVALRALGEPDAFPAADLGLRRALGNGLGWLEATVEAYLTLLAAAPDTHIARKLGGAEAAAVQRQAQEALAAGGVRTPARREAITLLDRELRDESNRRNPGATADLTGAAICVVLLEGGWRRGGGAGGRA